MAKARNNIIDSLNKKLVTDLYIGLIFSGVHESAGIIMSLAFKLIGFSTRTICMSEGYILIFSLGIFLFFFTLNAICDLPD